MEPKQRFRGWWWDEFDTGADDAEFDEGSAEAAQDLLPILRGTGPLVLQERVGDSEQFQRVVVGTPKLTEKDAYPGSLFER
jgi:hypothetical protein